MLFFIPQYPACHLDRHIINFEGCSLGLEELYSYIYQNTNSITLKTFPFCSPLLPPHCSPASHFEKEHTRSVWILKALSDTCAYFFWDGKMRCLVWVVGAYHAREVRRNQRHWAHICFAHVLSSLPTVSPLCPNCPLHDDRGGGSERENSTAQQTVFSKTDNVYKLLPSFFQSNQSTHLSPNTPSPSKAGYFHATPLTSIWLLVIQMPFPLAGLKPLKKGTLYFISPPSLKSPKTFIGMSSPGFMEDHQKTGGCL